MAYAAFEHLDRFLEGFATMYYGSDDNIAGTIAIATTQLQADLDYSAARFDQRLDAIARIPIVPVPVNPKTGSYNPFLIEWNACDTIFQKLKARHALEYKGEWPEWMRSFNTRCEWILTNIIGGEIVLDTDTTNKGIGIAEKITQSGFATFYSNWNQGFYSGSDRPKTFRFKISGTANGNEIGQALFSVSDDDGYSWWSDSYTTGTTWTDIESGLKIRWEPGTLTGTRRQIEYGDQWSVKCVPFEVASINANSKFKTFLRG